MNNPFLLSVLFRISWLLSFMIGSFLIFLVCDLSSGSYTSAAENFFTWGWFWAIVAGLIIKRMFLSDEYLQGVLDGNIVNNTDTSMSIDSSSFDQPISKDEDEPFPAGKSFENGDTDPTIVTLTLEDSVTEDPEPIRKVEPSKPNWIVTFFSDRPLAKIGGIILFLGAFFFLSLIWSNVGPVQKIMIGLIFGFFLYGIGVWMDKKGHISESRTLLGVGIAINTLTILSGRWLIGDLSGSIFSDTVTVLFLSFNTIFAVVTALVYNSRTFLIFSFVFAYFTPFLVGSETDSSILMMLYVAVISLGGYLLVWLFSIRKERDDDMKWLLRTLIIGNLILLSLTGLGLDSQTEFILASIMTLLLTSAGVGLSRKTETRDESLPSLLISAYIILACSIFGIGDGNQGTIYIAFLAMIPLMIYTGIFMIGASIMIYSWILLIPLFIALILFGVFGTSAILLILVPIVILYGISGVFLVTVMTTFFHYIFFLAISIFLFICTIAIDIRPVTLTSAERLITSVSAILFFLLSLWSSYRHKLIYLSLVTLISSSIILVFSLVPDWNASWIFYIVFLLITFLYPFFIGKSFREQFLSSIVYQVVANLFMIGELFYLGRGIWFTGESSSLITLGIIVFVLSVFSLLYSFLLLRTGRVDGETPQFTHEERIHNTALLGIPLSLFTLAIAVTFSDSPLVVSTAWILESSILAYYSGRVKNRLVLVGSLILLAIGLIRLLPFFDSIQREQYFVLVPIFIISLGLYFSLTFIQKRDEEPLGNLLDVLHIFGITMVGYAIMEIVPHTKTGWSLVGLNIFLMLSTWFYIKVYSKIISLWMVFLPVMIFLYHLGRIETLDMSFAPVLIQLSSLALGTYSVWYMKEKHEFGRYVFIYAFILVILITSLYVNQITENVFVVTIYLTFIATAYLLFGINGDRPKLRTIGLYIGTAVLLKILLYDIWAGVDDLTLRVVALMITGGVMIALSQLYGRRVNRSWSEEFAFSNFIANSGNGAQVQDNPWNNEKAPSHRDDMPFDEVIANDLKKYDISQIVSVELLDITGNSVLLSRRAGIIRVANYIVVHLKKNEFLPKELSKVLENILPHIRSSLPKSELEKMLTIIENWIISGGKILLREKKSRIEP